MTISTSRRNLMRGTGWVGGSAVIVAMGRAPVFAASTATIIENSLVDVWKCPGQSAPGQEKSWSYIFDVLFDTAPGSVTGTININGTIFTILRSSSELVTRTVNAVERQVYLTHLLTNEGTNSADAEGSGTIFYTVSGVPKQFVFDYNGSHPNHDLCGRV